MCCVRERKRPSSVIIGTGRNQLDGSESPVVVVSGITHGGVDSSAVSLGEYLNYFITRIKPEGEPGEFSFVLLHLFVIFFWTPK